VRVCITLCGFGADERRSGRTEPTRPSQERILFWEKFPEFREQSANPLVPLYRNSKYEGDSGFLITYFAAELVSSAKD
jgi:hypothetical protein